MRAILSFEQHRLNIGAETLSITFYAESYDQKYFPKLHFRRVKSEKSKIIWNAFEPQTQF